jgi:hypothetical protein
MGYQPIKLIELGKLKIVLLLVGLRKQSASTILQGSILEEVLVEMLWVNFLPLRKL